MSRTQNYGVLILAAGSSSRMGTSKQLLSIGSETLLAHTVNVAIRLKDTETVVVLGAEEEKHREALKDFNIEIIANTSWSAGMGSSLKAGLTKFVTKTPPPRAIIILVCDQPYLTTDHLNKLIEKHLLDDSKIVASRYNGVAGVPVLFGEKYFPTLLSLPDAQGAKSVLEKNSKDVLLVDFPYGEIDLDTPEDYQAFLKQKHP